MQTDRRIQAAAIRDALEQLLPKHFGKRCRVKNLRRRRSAYSSSAAIENLEVESDRGRHLRLVLKDLSPASRLSTAQEIRPHFPYDPSREIEAYQRFLDPKFGTAICYG